jgi:hypothetical protein
MPYAEVLEFTDDVVNHALSGAFATARPLDPQNPEIADLTADRVTRGGSISDLEEMCTAAARKPLAPDASSGFRVVLIIQPVPRRAALLPANPSGGAMETADTLKKDQERLVGQWRSPREMSGNIETYRTLTLGRPGSPITILRTVVNHSATGFSSKSTDEIKKGIPTVGATKEKAGKRFLTFQDFSNVYEVEYELTADTLRLSGQVAGVDLSGIWTSTRKK